MNSRTALALLALALPALPAAAQQAAPAAQAVPQGKLDNMTSPLGQIGQITVVEPTLANVQASADCKVDGKMLQGTIIQIMQDEKLPVVVGNATPPRDDVLRVTVRPEIATLKDGVVNCVSWVSLRVEVPEITALPPLTDLKSIIAVLWNRGGLIMTPVIDHPAGLNNGFSILARALVKQYRIDNPTPVTVQGPSATDALRSLHK